MHTWIKKRQIVPVILIIFDFYFFENVVLLWLDKTLWNDIEGKYGQGTSPPAPLRE